VPVQKDQPLELDCVFCRELGQRLGQKVDSRELAALAAE